MNYMNINSLLTEFNCECGRKHSCDIKSVYISSGAISRIGCEISHYQHILLVADNNTYAACGEKVKQQLGNRFDRQIVLSRKGVLIPNETAVGEIISALNENTDLIIGIGSGVIQDLCKYVSFQVGLPYHIVATAPSMDGYASVGAAMIMNDMKITYNAHLPEVIIGDVDVLASAPMEMIRAGYGDILGKFSCLNDWKLSHIVNGEYFCQTVYDLTYDMLNKTKDLGSKLLQRDKSAIQTLMESLVGVGIAMAYVGNSRPASGSEHHLSHFFEVVGILSGETYFPHGIDVAFSAVYTQKLREYLIKYVSWESIELNAEYDNKKYEQDIKRIYTKAADGIIELQNSTGLYEINRLPIYKEKWGIIKQILQDTKSSEELIVYLESAGMNIEEFVNLYGEEKIQNALKYGKDLKDRYSVLWLYYDIFNRGEIMTN